MSDSNRLQISYVEESTQGTTPGSPAMQKLRVTGEGLEGNTQYTRSEEMRPDRLLADTVPTDRNTGGPINGELSYGAWDDFIEGAMMSRWVKIAEITNPTSDSNITQVTDSSDTYTVASGGGSFKAGHLMLASGFTNAANNGLFTVASSTGTTVVVAGTPTLTDEASPPAGATIKVVGFVGASGDITASASGLGSTSLDFTTLGLAVGQWIKIGGTAAGTQFATAALNGWARITAIAATALTLDNRPSGWTTDAGTSKTIQVWVGDYIRNGTTEISYSIEKVLLSQGTPAYRTFKGMMMSTLSIDLSAGAIAQIAFGTMGWTETVSTSPLDASPDEADQNDVLNAVSHVARLSEAGASVADPNLVNRLNISLANNLREQKAIGTLGNIGIGVGDCDVSGSMTAYFGSKALYDKYLAGTESSLSAIVAKASSGTGKAIVFGIPRLKFVSAPANAGSRNQDVMQNLSFQALRDSTTTTHLQIDRFTRYDE